jgi:uroporphyrin-III C-methyltransferase
MCVATGHVYLVGAGPGAPDLLTVRATRILAFAEVVLYDRLVSPEILVLAPETAEFIYCGKDEGHQEAIQQQIFELLLVHTSAGRCVVRLKGGDPFLFGRGAEEVRFLRDRGIPVEVVPGVSSALSVPAVAGIPVTYRGVSNSVTIVSGRCRGGRLTDWAPYANAGTLVILMGVRYRERIAQALIEAGRPGDEPAAFVERGSTPEERVVESTLARIARGETDVSAPAVLVIGEVTRLRSALTTIADEAVA